MAEYRDSKSGSPFAVTDASLHETMQRQVREVLENSDLTEDQRQQILIALSCPCCGAGGLSMTIPLGPPTPGKGPVF